MGETAFLLTALLLGMAGSLHCLAMCGPIYVAVSGFYPTPGRFAVPLVLQLLGKLVGYALLGLFFGMLGTGLSLLVVQNTLMIISGILLIIMGLTGVFKVGVAVKFQNHVNRSMGRLIARRAQGAFLLGVLNGWIPCGLVYAAAMGAMASGSAIQGSLFLLFFGLGTAPVLGLAGLSRWLFPLRKTFNNNIWKQFPAILLGLLFLLKGMGLGLPYISPDINSKKPSQNCCTPKTTSTHNQHGTP